MIFWSANVLFNVLWSARSKSLGNTGLVFKAGRLEGCGFKPRYEDYSSCSIPFLYNIFLVCPIPLPLFSLFCVCNSQHRLHPSSIWYLGSNPRPLDHESYALTTRPWLSSCSIPLESRAWSKKRYWNVPIYLPMLHGFNPLMGRWALRTVGL